jgi:hypothetical protein
MKVRQQQTFLTPLCMINQVTQQEMKQYTAHYLVAITSLANLNSRLSKSIHQ